MDDIDWREAPEWKEAFARQEEREEKERAKRRKYKREHQLKHKHLYLEASKRWKDRNRDHLRNYELVKDHGITLDEFDELLKIQDGRCAICGTDTPRGSGTFHMDHSHKTGKNRGLLCNDCNTTIRNHSAEHLRKCVEYVEFWELQHLTEGK